MHVYVTSEARIRLQIEIEIRLDFDQWKQSLLNLWLDFFLPMA